MSASGHALRANPSHHDSFPYPFILESVMTTAKNALGSMLETCCTSPMTGFTRTGKCETGPLDPGLHAICVQVSAEFLAFSKSRGNDLSTPMPQYRFPGLVPGDRWCVTARNWLLAYQEGRAAPVVLACTHERTLEAVPLAALRECAVDVPDDIADL